MVAQFVPRLMARVVALLALQPADTLLDLGCGAGVLTHTFSRQRKQVIGVASPPAMIAACPPADNAAYVAASALSLPPDLTSALLHRDVAAQTAGDSAPWWFGNRPDYRALLEAVGFTVEVLETELRRAGLAVGSGGGIRD